MGGRSNLMKLIVDQIQSEELAAQAEELAAEAKLERLIASGPPVGGGISVDNWESWHRFGWLECPKKPNTTCDDPQCEIGISCRAMAAFGLAGDGTSLAYGLRPSCGAKNRQGKPCCNRVVPGKRRCRFHGGLSTGPRTPEGRARIAAAQKQRWANYRSDGRAGAMASGLRLKPKVTDPVFVDRYREADEAMGPGDSFMAI
jgi:hypothetical protein